MVVLGSAALIAGSLLFTFVRAAIFALMLVTPPRKLKCKLYLLIPFCSFELIYIVVAALLF